VPQINFKTWSKLDKIKLHETKSLIDAVGVYGCKLSIVC